MCNSIVRLSAEAAAPASPSSPHPPTSSPRRGGRRGAVRHPRPGRPAAAPAGPLPAAGPHRAAPATSPPGPRTSPPPGAKHPRRFFPLFCFLEWLLRGLSPHPVGERPGGRTTTRPSPASVVQCEPGVVAVAGGLILCFSVGDANL